MSNRTHNRQLNKSNGNNGGFSLIELIVVIAIMVILAVAAAVTFLNSAGQKVSSSTSIVANYLDNVMNYTMTGKYVNSNNDSESEEGSEGTKTENKNAVFTIEYKDGKYYVGDGISKEEALSSGITITYDTYAGETPNTKVENTPLKITFSRINGSFNPLDSGDYVKYINITSNSNSDYAKVIRLYNKTGEYEIVNAQGDENK